MTKLITVLFLFVFWIGSSFAGEGEDHWDKGKWRKRIKKELNLTEDQVLKMEKIHSKYHSEIKDLRSEKKGLQNELKEMAKKPDVKENSLKEKHNKLQDVRRNLEDKRFSMMLETRGILKADQIANLDKLYMKKRLHNKRGKRQAQEAESK